MNEESGNRWRTKFWRKKEEEHQELWKKEQEAEKQGETGALENSNEQTPFPPPQKGEGKLKMKSQNKHDCLGARLAILAAW